MIRQFELVERLKAYDPNADEELLNRAYVFSMKAHGSQVRASGDPYFSHPLLPWRAQCGLPFGLFPFVIWNGPRFAKASARLPASA